MTAPAAFDLAGQWVADDTTCIMQVCVRLHGGEYRYVRLCTGLFEERRVGHVREYTPDLPICPLCFLTAEGGLW